MRILGIDPGLSRTGFALLEIAPGEPTTTPALVDAGVFRLDSTRPIAERLDELARDLGSLIDEHGPTHGAV